VSGLKSHPVSASEPPSDGVEIVASEAERNALAAENSLVAVDALTVTATLTPGAKGSVTVDGRVVADIVQTCVVSLVPVSQHIDETFSVKYVREALPQPKPGAEIVFDAADPDPPEVLEGPTVDVAALAEEYFVLAIDPYPRAPGAELPPELAREGDDKGDSPFAILAGLGRASEPKR
jgi:uncharacterized metal-binding protein YceD (DUF177 family)